MKWGKELVLEWFPQGGYFVEAGAHDGVGDSQTKILEDTGKWTGICVEPSSAFAGLLRNRKCRVDNRALYVDSGVSNFREMQGDAIELSGIEECFIDHWDRETLPHKQYLVHTVNLTDLLLHHQAPPTIEFLSLDTEGSEYRILLASDFNKYQFLTIQVEHNGVASAREKIASLLHSQNYWTYYDTEVEAFFVHESLRKVVERG